MARDVVDITWPVAGFDRKLGFQSQRPFTTPDCLNVRNNCVFEQRLRGGSRPGLVQVLPPKASTPPTTGNIELTAEKDCYLDGTSALDDVNLNSTLLRAGRFGSTNRWRIVMHFDVSSLDGATIETATLTLKGALTNTTGGAAALVCRLTQTAWVEDEVTWNAYNSGNNWATAGGDFTATGQVSFNWPTVANQTITVDIATLVQDAIDNRSGALHVLIKSSDDTNNGADDQISIHSSEHSNPDNNPKLLINYTQGGDAGSGLLADNEIRLLNTVRTISGSTAETYFDDFTGSSMSGDWSDPDWEIDSVQGDGLPTVQNSYAMAPAGQVFDFRQALLADQSIATQGYREVAISQWIPLDHNFTYLMMDMADSSDPTTGGIMARFQRQITPIIQDYVNLYVDGTLVAQSNIGGRLPGIVFDAKMSADSSGTVRVYWSNSSQADITYNLGSYTAAGDRVGFAMMTRTSNQGVSIGSFRVYHSLASGALPPVMLVASSGGALFRESTNGQMVQVSSDLTLPTDKWISSANRLQSLYIADYGVRITNTAATATTSGSVLTDSSADFTTVGVDADDDMLEVISGGSGINVGTYPITSFDATTVTVTGTLGTASGVNYRIVRAPKVFDSDDLTLTRLTASAGFIPPNCSIVAAFNDRLAWAGDTGLLPEAVYFSAIGDPTDYNYGTATQDAARVFDPARSSGSAYIGDAVTALIPHLDDYLIIGCKRSVWIQRGDPGYDVPPDVISREIGILSQSAWCYTPEGTIVAMTLDGLYLFAPTPQVTPERLSRTRMPQELLAIDTTLYDVLLEYNTWRNGISIFVTPKTVGPTRHFWFGWETKEFMPDLYQSDHEPTAITSHAIGGVGARVIVMGCRDGYLRIHEDSAADDDGTNFTSYALIGPIQLGGNGYFDGMLREVIGQLSTLSNTVTMSFQVGNSIEAAFRATPRDHITLRAGKSLTARPRLRGNACFIRIEGTPGSPWAMEQITLVRERLGKQRLLA